MKNSQFFNYLLYTFVHLSKIIRFYKDYFLLTDKMAAVFATERTNNLSTIF